MEFSIGRVAGCMLVACSVIGVAGCQSTSTEPQPTVRSGEATAPADLQLTCASEAATQLGADSTKVLPVSSRSSGSDEFQVDLNVDGRNAVCTIGADGTVKSVEAVG